MNADSGKICPIVLRIIGLLLLIAGAVLTESRTGDWFFRSETFPDRHSQLLLMVRIVSGIAGVLLLAGGGILGRRMNRGWRGLPESGKLVIITLFFALAGTLIYWASDYFRENMVLLETITKYKVRFKILGFSALVQTDQMRTADFLTSIFLAISGTISYCMYSLYRLKVCPNSLQGGTGTRRMWLLFSLGLYYLALDEYFSLHEFAGDNIAIFNMFTITRHPDDLVIGLYFLIACAIMIRFRRYLLRCAPALAMLCIGVILHLFAVISDAFVDYYEIEEGLELTAIIFYSSAIAQYALGEILSIKRGE
jgi:hypothetical protein